MLAMLLEQLAEGDSSSVFLRSRPFILRLCDALPVLCQNSALLK